ncbi:MAG: Pyrimidine-nucleoside phosphorylase [Elusimicrobia bacterium ADurb.Bin231]|nr:MAG: Pyrimidine-nucleoside phosphorylase [Elusimicrobia bacterium ADurb.Bin231]
MLMYELIKKKRDGAELTKEEISFIIDNYTNDKMPVEQMAAFLMTVFLRGMTAREATDLTMAMVDSGERVDLSNISGFKVDKHSTGGVGDTTSLVLGPIVAACGGKVAKMTGRGLGHTGGTIDKLESIPGVTCSLSKEKFVENVNTIGLALMGQTAKLAPADKKIYALRDVTATVDSIPLIAGSIMSKKLAAGSDGIVLDVKTGSGAFMEKYQDALNLARAMVDIGEGAGKKMVAFITSMEEPLGLAIGNSIEVKEAIDTLSGKGPKDLTDLCVELGSSMLLISGIAASVEDGKEKLRNVIKSKKGLEKLKAMVKAQGGNPEAIDNTALLPQCKKEIEVLSEQSGYVEKINALEVGMTSLVLGAGRMKKEDIVDPSVGIYLKKKVGDKVEKGEPLAVFHTDGDMKKYEDAKKRFLAAYKIGPAKVPSPKFFYARVTKDGVEEF